MASAPLEQNVAELGSEALVKAELHESKVKPSRQERLLRKSNLVPAVKQLKKGLQTRGRMLSMPAVCSEFSIDLRRI